MPGGFPTLQWTATNDSPSQMYPSNPRSRRLSSHLPSSAPPPSPPPSMVEPIVPTFKKGKAVLSSHKVRNNQ